jgi:hypothetical protein
MAMTSPTIRPTPEEVRDDLLALLDHIGKVHSRLLDIKFELNWKPDDTNLERWREAFMVVNNAHVSVSLKLNTVLAEGVQASVDNLEKRTADIRKKVEGLDKAAAVLKQVSKALDLFTSIINLFT